MRAAGLALILGAMMAVQAQGQPLPFAPGERLTYRAHSARLGHIGRAAMWIEGPVSIRGQQVWHLRFEIDSRVGFVRVLNVSESWLDAPRMRSLRFTKRERHPLSRHEEQVEIFAEEQRWESTSGNAGRTMSDQPLDELSFIYFLRTASLAASGALRYDRHFEMSRNPTLVRVVGHDTLSTPAGTFATVIVEMEVRDGRYKGGGAIRLHLTDDARRLPVRIESSVPVAGRAVLTLESYVLGAGLVTARDRSPF